MKAAHNRKKLRDQFVSRCLALLHRATQIQPTDLQLLQQPVLPPFCFALFVALISALLTPSTPQCCSVLQHTYHMEYLDSCGQKVEAFVRASDQFQQSCSAAFETVDVRGVGKVSVQQAATAVHFFFKVCAWN